MHKLYRVEYRIGWCIACRLCSIMLNGVVLEIPLVQLHLVLMFARYPNKCYPDNMIVFIYISVLPQYN